MEVDLSPRHRGQKKQKGEGRAVISVEEKQHFVIGKVACASQHLWSGFATCEI